MLSQYVDAYEKTINEWEIKLPEMCVHTSQKELDSVNYERDVEKMKKAEYMEDHIGEIYQGTISGVCEFGIFIELDNRNESWSLFMAWFLFLFFNSYFSCLRSLKHNEYSISSEFS